MQISNAVARVPRAWQENWPSVSAVADKLLILPCRRHRSLFDRLVRPPIDELERVVRAIAEELRGPHSEAIVSFAAVQ